AELSSSEPIAPTSTPPTTNPPVASTSPTTNVPATMVPPTSTPMVDPTEDAIELDGWFSDTGAVFPAILLGLLLVAISISTHFLRRTLRSRGRRDSRARLVSWSAAAVPFFVTLFYWYHFINMLLPAST
ncbi:MAG: hypothetical protein ACKOA5_10770, partial [Actinomycetota bacterium]